MKWVLGGALADSVSIGVCLPTWQCIRLERSRGAYSLDLRSFQRFHYSLEFIFAPVTCLEIGSTQELTLNRVASLVHQKASLQ